HCAMIELSAATLHDIPTLLALEAACFDADRLSAASMRHMITRGHGCMLVAKQQDGLVVGYGLVLWRKHSRIGRVYSLAIAPHARGQGLAERLMQALEATSRAQSCTHMRLE